MTHIISQVLAEKNIKISNFIIDNLYKAGIDNVKDNIEFYSDKPYSCDSVIQELFLRGVIEYINNNKLI